MVATTEARHSPPRPAVAPDTMIPDLLRAHPHTRAVFNRYGLRGCGGRHGPAESVAFFARTHGVDEPRLLGELREAIDAPAPAPVPDEPPRVADTIYRRYFVGGIVLILTAGASWGAWLLWKIGMAAKFTGAGLQDVNAHGHAQIYGWVGLFIMGFAYQAFPRKWHTDLAAPWLAVVAFVSMVAGLIVRTAGMTLSGAWAGAVPTAMIGGGLELAAVLVFVGQMIATFRRSLAKVEPYVGFIFLGLFWFVAMAGVDLWHTYTTMTAPTRDRLLWYVATYQAPLRDLQIHGLALFMILGVSIRLFPAIFGLPAIPARRAWAALWVLTAAVVLECVVFVAYRWTGNHVLAALLLVPWLMLSGGVAMVALPWRLWRPLPPQYRDDRCGKFVRAAYAWLVVSLVLLLLLPAYLKLSGIPFSHAYYGAIRHAVTVGFISLMIMGMAAKVVPMLSGVDPRTLGRLWGPFVLVNLGCFLRVSTQTLTDFYPRLFAIIGASGTLEVIGIAWWGFGTISVIRRGARRTGETEEPSRPRPNRIVAHDYVTDVLAWFPETAAVFNAYGFTLLNSPLLRRTLARGVQVAQAAALRGVSVEDLVANLNLVIVVGEASKAVGVQAYPGRAGHGRHVRLHVLQ